jgi:ParB family chromosome partitioning protein
MLIDIDKVVIRDRIRKDYGDVQELADDIKENGLINPPTVTPDFELIAGERRYRALKLLGYQQIEVRIMTVRDALHQLKMEISENENRKDFTFSEKMRWAEQLKSEYKKIAEANQKAGTSAKCLAQVGRVDEKVAEETGIGSKEQLRKAEFVNANADEEMIRNLDDGKLSINAAYVKLKEDLNKANVLLAKAQEDTCPPDEDYLTVAAKAKQLEDQVRELYEASRKDEKEKSDLRKQLETEKSEKDDLTRRFNKQGKSLEKEVIKETVEVIPEKYKKMEKELEEAKKQLAEAKSSKSQEDPHLLRIIGEEDDPVKYTRDAAQRLQLAVSELSCGLMSYELDDEMCRRMPPHYKHLIIKQSAELIERLNVVCTYLADEEGEIKECKTA